MLKSSCNRFFSCKYLVRRDLLEERAALANSKVKAMKNALEILPTIITSNSAQHVILLGYIQVCMLFKPTVRDN